MADPTLVPISTPLQLGQAYTISSLFTYVPGTGPDGEPVLAARVGFQPSPNELFTGDFVDAAGFDDYGVSGDYSAASGAAPGVAPPWSSGTVTFTTGAIPQLQGYLQFVIGPSTQFPNGFIFADPVTYSFNITGAPLTGQVVLSAETEDMALPANTTVATFTDSNTTDVAGGFTASINWGDGRTTSGTVTGSNGSFAVSGGHTYADEGTDPLTVTITRTSDNTQIAPTGNVTVGENDVLTPQGVTISANVNQAFSTAVASFTDTDTVSVAGDFTASINWGDGTPVTAGTVTGSNGSFQVSGSHTYAAAGQEIVAVTMTDDGPGTATATAISEQSLPTAELLRQVDDITRTLNANPRRDTFDFQVSTALALALKNAGPNTTLGELILQAEQIMKTDIANPNQQQFNEGGLGFLEGIQAGIAHANSSILTQTINSIVDLFGGTPQSAIDDGYVTGAALQQYRDLHLGGNTPPTSTPPPPTNTGVIISPEGYITGATIFADKNGNGILDPGEISTVTGSSGLGHTGAIQLAAGSLWRNRHVHRPSV